MTGVSVAERAVSLVAVAPAVLRARVDGAHTAHQVAGELPNEIVVAACPSPPAAAAAPAFNMRIVRPLAQHNKQVHSIIAALCNCLYDVPIDRCRNVCIW